MTAFVKVVEADSFSEAARRLGVAKSIVSRRVGALETRLGVRLFNRTTRRLSLTEAGHAYYERVRRILTDIAEADEVAGDLQSELRGRLRIAAPMSFGISQLSPTIAAFLKLHPALEIDLDLNDRRVDLVNEGYDLAVRIGRLPDSALMTRILAPCRHLVCASPDYLAERGKPLSPDDLANDGHECLVYSNRAAAEQWQFNVGGEWRAVRVRPRRLAVNNGEVLCAAAIAGVGLIALPTFIVGDAVRDGRLRPVLRNFAMADPAIHAVWPSSRQLSAKVRALVDSLSASFGDRPVWDRDID